MRRKEDITENFLKIKFLNQNEEKTRNERSII